MLLVDFERRIVEVNGAGLELIGYPREQMVGRRLDIFLEPSEWSSIEQEWRAFQRRGEFNGERALIRADGRAVAVQYAARWARVGARDLALYVALHA
jgi:PAS domain S-box-containing protein